MATMYKRYVYLDYVQTAGWTIHGGLSTLCMQRVHCEVKTTELMMCPAFRDFCMCAGASIHMGKGGHVPPIFGLGGHYHECPPQYF